jgi:hypothetical protein
MSSGTQQATPEIAVAPNEDVLVRELRADESERWNGFTENCSDASLYHGTLWRNFVQEVFGHRPIYLICERRGELSGVLPMFLVSAPLLGSKLISLPYDIGAGGARAVDRTAESALITGAIRQARERGVDYLELRHRESVPGVAAAGLNASEPVIITELELGDSKRVWSRIKGDHRRSIRTAQERGVVIRDGISEQDYLEFYGIVQRVFRAFGTPPYGPGYFRALWRLLHPSGTSRLLLAHAGGRCVGGMLLFCWGKVMIDKFCLALPEATSLRATAALYSRAIELGLELGFEKLNMGTSARTQKGLLDFKERWGAVSRPAVFYTLPVRGKAPSIERYYDSTGIERRLWRKLPLPVTVLGGSILSRWFC